MKKLKIISIVNQSFNCLVALSLMIFYLNSKNILLLLLLIMLFYNLFRKSIIIFLSILTIVIFTFIYYNITLNKLLEDDNNKEIKCLIYTLPNNREKLRFYCKTKTKRYVVYTKNDINLNLGDYVLINGKKELAKNNTVPYQFNYAKYLHSQKIAYIVNAESVKVIGKSKRLDYVIINKINSYYQNSPINNYLLSFIIGDKLAIDEEFRNDIQMLNISHLFVVSGFHVGFIYLFIMFILKHLRFTKEFSKIITYIILIVFLIINLFSISIFRAISLIFGIEIKNKYYLPIDNIQILSLIACINIIINPFTLQNTSFILSYLITLILFISKTLFSKYEGFLFNFSKVNVIAQLFSLPIIANFNFTYNFLSFLIAPVLNLYYTFIIFPLIFINLLFKSLGNISYYFFYLYEKLVNFLASLKFFNYNTGFFTTFRMIIYYYLLIQLLKRLEIKKFNYVFTLLLIITILFYHKLTFSEKVTFIDVGQGDSIYIQSTFSSCNALIDVGGSFYYHPGENVAKYLKSLQISKIDVLFISHSDIDHAGDYKYILNQFKIKKIVFSYYDNSELQREIEAYALGKKINIKKVKAYNKVDCGDLSFFVINPLKKNNTINDNSLVLFLLFNGDKYLFMGDASSNIVNLNNLDKIDFLKVSHHGSKYQTNEDFFNHINVKNAIISVGKNNYNHPADEVLNLLKTNNITIYRTDLNGSVSVKYYLRKKRMIFTYQAII